MMTEEQLVAIRAREAAATPGPWAKDGSLYAPDVDITWADDEGEYVVGTIWDNGFVIRADAEFIAHARKDIPALLAENDSLRAQLAGCEEECALLEVKQLLAEPTPNTVRYEDVKEELLRDSEVRAAYDALEPAYQAACRRIERGLT